MNKPILCLDFDGVIHSYSSGWKGARNIPDPPVDGAIEFLVSAIEEFEVHIFSARSGQFGGRRAMKRWIKRWAENYFWSNPSVEVLDTLSLMGPGDAIPDPANVFIRNLMKNLKFPKKKPPAFVSLDDRVLTFEGTWPSLEELKAFKPWNKRDV